MVVLSILCVLNPTLHFSTSSAGLIGKSDMLSIIFSSRKCFSLSTGSVLYSWIHGWKSENIHLFNLFSSSLTFGFFFAIPVTVITTDTSFLTTYSSNSITRDTKYKDRVQ